MKRKNGFLTFLCACCFGAGQMYLGMMKRGVSIMLAACLIFAVGGVLGISILLVLLPVVWFFAFFDTFNLRAMGVDAMPPQERAALKTKAGKTRAAGKAGSDLATITIN